MTRKSIIVFLFPLCLMGCLQIDKSGKKSSETSSSGHPSLLMTSSSSYHFGYVSIGETSLPVTVTIRNNGDGSATNCQTPTLGGHNGLSDFKIENDTCGTNNLLPGTNCSFSVLAKPTKTGILTGTLTRNCQKGGIITSGDNVLQVEGIEANLHISPSSYAFNDITVNCTPEQYAFIVTNTGSAYATNCSTPQLSNTTDFQIMTSNPDRCGSIDKLYTNAKCSILVKAAPASSGTKESSLIWVCTQGGSVSASLLVKGLPTPSPDSPSVSSSNLDFGTLVKGTPSSSQLLTFSNPSTGSTYTECYAPTPAYATTNFSFSYGSSCSESSFAPGDSCSLTIIAKPTALPSNTPSVTYHCNDSNFTDIKSILTVKMVDISLSLASGTLTQNSASTTATNSAPTNFSQFRITNSGDGNASDCSISFTENSSIFRSDPSSSFDVSGSNYYDLYVYATPRPSSQWSTYLKINCDVGGTLTSDKITANSPHLLISPSSYFFGQVIKDGNNQNKTFTINNVGSGDASNCNVSLDNTDNFTLSGSCSSIASGGSCSMTVTTNSTFSSNDYDTKMSITCSSPNAIASSSSDITVTKIIAASTTDVPSLLDAPTPIEQNHLYPLSNTYSPLIQNSTYKIQASSDCTFRILPTPTATSNTNCYYLDSNVQSPSGVTYKGKAFFNGGIIWAPTDRQFGTYAVSTYTLTIRENYSTNYLVLGVNNFTAKDNSDFSSIPIEYMNDNETYDWIDQRSIDYYDYNLSLGNFNDNSNVWDSENHSLIFDGQNDYLATSNPLNSLGVDPTPNIIISMLIRPTDARNATLFEIHNDPTPTPGIILEQLEQEKLKLTIGDQTIETQTGSFITNNWHYITAIFQRGYSFLFVNDNLGGYSESTPTLDLDSLEGSLHLGANIWGLSNYFKGNLGDFKLYMSNGENIVSNYGYSVAQELNSKANLVRKYPISNIITDNIVLHLDAANAKGGFACPECSDTSWFNLSMASYLQPATAQMVLNGAVWGGCSTSPTPTHIELDGNDDYIDLSSYSSIIPEKATWSFEFWLQPEGADAHKVAYEEDTSGNTRFLFEINEDKQTLTTYRDSDNQENTVNPDPIPTVITNNWNHIVGTLDTDNNSAYLYVNTIQHQSTFVSANNTIISPSSSAEKYLGRASNIENTFRGNIGLFRVYSDVLSLSEVKQNCLAMEERFTSKQFSICGYPFDTNQIITDELVLYIDSAYGQSNSSGHAKSGCSGPNKYVANIGGETRYLGEFNNASTCWSGDGQASTTPFTIRLDGSDDYINLGNQSNLEFTSTDSAFTIEAWIKGSGVIMSQYDASSSSNSESYVFYYDGTNIGIWLHEADCGATTPCTNSWARIFGSVDTGWQHIVVTVDVSSDTINCYHNNASVVGSNDLASGTKTSLSSNLLDASSSHLIGGKILSSGTASTFNGDIAIIRVYNKVLSTSEISQNYDANKGRFGL